MGSGLLRKKPVESIDHAGFKRTLGFLDLSNIGVAAIIGAGIFFLLAGEAQSTGPAVIVALLLGGLIAVLAAFSYAEASSYLPGNGSAYSFAYAVFGSLPAFIVGWFFIATYAVGNAGVTNGWGEFFVPAVEGTARAVGAEIAIPDRLTRTWVDKVDGVGGIVNLPSILLVVLVTLLACLPIRTSTRVNNALVGLKVLIVLFVIVAGAFLVRPENWTPFSPAGTSGIAASTATLFFAYLGFDTIAATGAEARDPKRNLPLAILVSVGVCALLYVLMAAVVTGMAGPEERGGVDTVAEAFGVAGQGWAGGIITAGALVALATVAYAFHLAMARIVQAMAEDGFLPAVFARVTRRGVPVPAVLGVGAVTLTAAAAVPVTALIDVGVLAAVSIFVIVSAGTIALRRRVKAHPNVFRVAWPVHAGAIVLLVAMAVFGFEWLLLVSFIGWIGAGLAVYGFFAHRSAARRLGPTPPGPSRRNPRGPAARARP